MWWQEDDFRLTRRIDLTAMVEVLNRTPNLAQLALRRQPWNDERAAGDCGGAPDDFPGGRAGWPEVAAGIAVLHDEPEP